LSKVKASLRRLSNYKGWVGCHKATGNPPDWAKPITPHKIKKRLTGINKEEAHDVIINVYIYP
jgi:predicted DNA-binding transcriptional regulator